MSSFEQAKETLMLLITMMVLIFVSVFFYIIFANFKIGSVVNVRSREAELVGLRVLKCLENNEEADTCLKTNDYAAKVDYNKKVAYLNEKLYREFYVKNVFLVSVYKNGEFYVTFKNE